MGSNREFQRANAELECQREGMQRELESRSAEAASQLAELRSTVECLIAMNERDRSDFLEVTQSLRTQVDQQALEIDQERKQASHLMAVIRTKNDKIEALVKERSQGPLMEVSMAKEVAKKLQSTQQGCSMLQT